MHICEQHVLNTLSFEYWLPLSLPCECHRGIVESAQIEFDIWCAD